MKYGLIFLLTLFFSFANEGTLPPIKLKSLSGNYVDIQKEIGDGPILINFWATWCTPCIKEMKAIEPIYNKYKDQGFKVFSISIDDINTVSRIKGFMKRKKFPFTVLLDTNHKVKTQMQVSNPPFTLLVNKKGEIVYKHTGYNKGDEKEIEVLVKKLIQEKQ